MDKKYLKTLFAVYTAFKKAFDKFSRIQLLQKFVTGGNLLKFLTNFSATSCKESASDTNGPNGWKLLVLYHRDQFSERACLPFS